MERAKKSEVVSSLNQSISNSSSMVVVHYHGLTVSDITALRKLMRAKGASFTVTKNSLVRLAVSGTNYDKISSLFAGPTAIAFSKDPIAAAKGIVEYAKDNEKLVIVGGMVEGQVIDTQGVKALATIPSLDELRAKIVGVLNAPATRIVSVLQAPAGQVARVIGAHATKNS